VVFLGLEGTLEPPYFCKSVIGFVTRVLRAINNPVPKLTRYMLPLAEGISTE